MNGKKFIVIFLGLTILTGALISIWIKKGYDTRPVVQIESEKK